MFALRSHSPARWLIMQNERRKYVNNLQRAASFDIQFCVYVFCVVVFVRFCLAAASAQRFSFVHHLLMSYKYQIAAKKIKFRMLN